MLAIYLQYLKKEVSDDVDFLHADKHESLLKMILWFWWGWSSIPKVPKVDKHRSFLQVDFNTLGNKVLYKAILLLLMGMIKHSQSTKSKNLQCLYNISKKKLEMKFFCMQINIYIPTNVSRIMRETHASALFFTLTRTHNEYYLRHELLCGF